MKKWTGFIGRRTISIFSGSVQNAMAFMQQGDKQVMTSYMQYILSVLQCVAFSSLLSQSTQQHWKSESNAVSFEGICRNPQYLRNPQMSCIASLIIGSIIFIAWRRSLTQIVSVTLTIFIKH